MMSLAAKRLGWIERTNLRIVRATFRPGLVDGVIRFLQRTLGQFWIHHCTKNLRHVIGFERIEGVLDERSILVVANHRSFFDLYVVTTELMRRGMKKRIAFMVRSKFFYDSLVGLFVNFMMSFLAMYPPVFRERKKLALNAMALDEFSWLLSGGVSTHGVFAGIHPEGTRNLGDDPYTLLPPKPGVGRIVYGSRVQVIPVFVTGLGNDLKRQIFGNFDGTGEKICIVFGGPIDFGNLFEENPSHKVYSRIADHCMDAIRALMEEEKAFRACGPLET